MATELGESTQVKANLAFVAKVIAIVGTCVWGYSVLWNKLNALDLEILRLKHDVELNMYDGGRHEMLNEINKEEVYHDILNWMNNKLI